MWNFKDLWWFLLMLIVGRVVCSPVEKCMLPPELVKNYIPKLNENLQKCKDVSEETLRAFCREVQQLSNNISSCGVGKMFYINELRETLIDKILKIPMNEANDVCQSFENIKKVIESARPNEESLGNNHPFCQPFCRKYTDECLLLLKLYWARNVLNHAGLENDQPTETNEDLTSQTKITGNNDEISSKPVTKENPTQNKNSGKKDSVESSDSNAKDNKNIPPKIETKPEKKTVDDVPNKPATPSNLDKDDKSSLPAHLSNSKVTLPPMPPTKLSDQKIQNTDSNKKEDKSITVDKPETNVNADRETKTVPPKSNTLADSNSKPQVDVSITVDDDKNSNNLDKDIKKDMDKIQDSKATKKLDNKAPADDETKSLPKPIEESQMDSDLELEKTDKTEFENQANEFSEEFSDPANEYTDGEPPPDTLANPEPTEENGENKKKAIKETVSKENVVDPPYPEEEDGHFFAYFLTIVVLCIAGYLVFHNKQKIIALIIEGRHERRRRPNGGYKRLDSKESSKATSQVIF